MRSLSVISVKNRYAPLLHSSLSDKYQYPILESAITGRLNMSDSSNEADPRVTTRPTSLLDTRKMDDAELRKLRNAMAEREGLVASIFDLLRTVPR